MTKRKIKLTPKVEKFALGDFVTANSEAVAQYQNQLNNINPVQNNTVNSALSTAGTGASIGTAIAPGLGTAIGAGVGLLGGAIMGIVGNNKQKKAQQNLINDINFKRKSVTEDIYNSSIDTSNDNPYGVYEDGGEVNEQIINIEKGELQIDPESGKILREFTGINPQTGGLYQYHSAKGDEDVNNFVSAKEGSFIVTKNQAKKYKDAIDNNDKLYQNAIKQNIRNHKRKISLMDNQYADGGDIKDYFSNWANNTNLNSVGVNPNITFNSNINPSRITAPVSNAPAGIDYGNIASQLLGYGTGIYNTIKGSQSPNTQEFNPIRLDVENRRKILSEMPEEVSVNPALNRVRRSRSNAYRAIDQGTSNSVIARANKLSLENSFLDAENDIYYQNELANNQIRSQRASILSGLSNQDQARAGMNSQLLMQTDEINRQLGLAKEQQFNTGISQLVQNFQNNKMIGRQRNNDNLRWKVLQDMNPYLKHYSNDWEQYFNR